MGPLEAPHRDLRRPARLYWAPRAGKAPRAGREHLAAPVAAHLRPPARDPQRPVRLQAQRGTGSQGHLHDNASCGSPRARGPALRRLDPSAPLRSSCDPAALGAPIPTPLADTILPQNLE
uniref:Uncharacterized protein n=1 Tax=Rangifer tarandus platyrhynchus TaxID=3082113 RepID=A0ACB0E694_RANTA|nr:unnamed protein product [Rangifer tarandus platyrhynchus]